MTNSNKVRMKVGENEFDAEGSDEIVTTLFNAWKELIANRTEAARTKPQSLLTAPLPSRFSHVVEEIKTKDGMIGATWDIFECDDKKKLITLRVNPTGETRDSDAVLLILYGFKRTWGTDEVKVGKLKECLALSGLRPERIDRTVAGHVHQGLLLKAGRGPGGKYRLSNPGYERADALARSLFEQLI